MAGPRSAIGRQLAQRSTTGCEVIQPPGSPVPPTPLPSDTCPLTTAGMPRPPASCLLACIDPTRSCSPTAASPRTGGCVRRGGAVSRSSEQAGCCGVVGARMVRSARCRHHHRCGGDIVRASAGRRVQGDEQGADPGQHRKFRHHGQRVHALSAHPRPASPRRQSVRPHPHDRALNLPPPARQPGAAHVCASPAATATAVLPRTSSNESRC
jgi:hypothetical protein